MIPLNKIAQEILKKKRKSLKTDFVFTSSTGKQLHPDRPYHKLKSALNKLKIEGDVHKLRHTFASKLVMKGEPLYNVQRLLGHKDIQTTMVYAHLAPE